MRPLLRSRLGLSAALVGFVLIVTEFGFAVYGLIWTYHWMHAPLTDLGYVSPVRIYLPASLLTLASLIIGFALYRAVRGRSRRSWHAAGLAALAAFLLIYRPPMSLGQMARGINSTLPWVAPAFWSQGGNAALSLGLQVAVYLAAAAYIVAIVLATPQRRTGRQSAALLPANGPSALWRRRR